MNPKFKLGLYTLLTIIACVSGYLAWRDYDRLMNEVQSKANTASGEAAGDDASSNASYEGYDKVMTYGIFFFVAVVGWGFLLAHDVANYFGNKTLKVLYNDEGEGAQDPAYDLAEQEWADGHYLEAIRLMREYLKDNPREVHAAFRIAEIYEKDLQNYLAAALEYEDILKEPLERERWGWAAIHLCNLYSKLNQPEKTVELLQEISSDYAETRAAEKARKRLALLETEGAPTNDTEKLVQGNAPSDGSEKD